MNGRSRILHATAAVVLIAFLASLIQFLPLSTSAKYQRVFVDLGHVPLFAGIAWAVLYVTGVISGQPRVQPSLYGIAGLVILLIAISSEAIQSFDPNRSASVADLLRNCVGGSLGFMLHLERASKATGSRRKRTLVFPAMLLVVAVLAPGAWTAAGYFHKFHSWPNIIGDNYRLERVFAAPYESEIEEIRVPAEWQVRYDESGFILRLRDCMFCGILLQELAQGWTGLSRFCLDLTNPRNEPLRLSVQLGNALMFFRSSSTYETAVTVPANSRANECLALTRFSGGATAANPGVEFRSAALLIDADAPIHRDILVHRIWLE